MSELRFEIKKFLRLKSLNFFLVLLCIFTLSMSLSAFHSFDGDKFPTNYLIVRIIPLNGNFYIPIIIAFFATRIFSIEYENNIVSALKLHNKNLCKMYVYKTIIAVIYILLAYFIQLFSALFIEGFIYGYKIDFIFNISNLEIIFEQKDSMVNIIVLYLNQFFGTLLILEIFIFFLFILKSFLKASTLTLFSIFIFDVLYIFLKSKNLYLKKYYMFIPFNSEYIWRNLFFLDFGDIYISLIIWTLFLIIINIIILHKNFIRRSYFE